MYKWEICKGCSAVYAIHKQDTVLRADGYPSPDKVLNESSPEAIFW